MTILLITLAVLVVIVAYAYGANRSKKRIAARFSTRTSMSMEEFYDTFYKDSGIDKQAIAGALEHVASELSLPVGKLRPSDRFDKELAPDKGWEWSSGHGILEIELKALAKAKNKHFDPSKIVLLDDYLKFIGDLEKVPK